MAGRLFSFTDLLVPVQPETFFARYWESQPLHVQRSESDYHAQLLTNRDVEAAISSGGLRYSAIQLARGRGFFLPEAFTRTIVPEVISSPTSPTSSAFVPSINRVLPFHCQGSTGLGSRSARSPPRSKRSSTMRCTQTSTSLPRTPSVSVPITTRTRSWCFKSPTTSVGVSTSRLCRSRTAAALRSPKLRSVCPTFRTRSRSRRSSISAARTCAHDGDLSQFLCPRHAGNRRLYLDRTAYRVGVAE